MEARTVNAAEKIFMEYPFKNRVDNLCYFLVSHDTGVEKWLNLYYDGSINSRIVIPYSIDELLNSKSDQWFIRERLRKYSFDKDLFDYTLPLQSDNSFFGRQQILGRYIDSIRRCQNRGIFGLRKTGKTSLLFKIMRTVKEQGLGQVFFYDCKKPQVRKKRWYELLYDINMSIAGRLGMKKFTSQTGEIQCVSSSVNLKMCYSVRFRTPLHQKPSAFRGCKYRKKNSFLKIYGIIVRLSDKIVNFE